MNQNDICCHQLVGNNLNTDLRLSLGNADVSVANGEYIADLFML